MNPQQQKPSDTSSHLKMKALDLPQEYWDGKSEPISPPCTDLFAFASDLLEPENWLYDDNFANEILLNLEHKSGDELIRDMVESDELVIELYDLKEENWPPHAVDIGTNSAYSELDNIIITEQTSSAKSISIPPYDIDVNFDGNVLRSNTFTTLTPPQSPPPLNGVFSIIQQQNENTPVQLHTLHYHPATTTTTDAATAAAIHVPTTSSIHNTTGYVIPNAATELHPLHIGAAAASHYSDNVNANAEVKNELEQAQLVDQIIEELAKDLPDMSDEYESQYTSSPPSQMEEESTTDDEWMPSNSVNSSPDRYSSNSNSSSSCSGDDTLSNDLEKSSCATGKNKKRRPYGRGVEDRKIRKKEQNKNAATRYRQKKKLEMELVLGEEQKLTERNEELQAKLGKFLREIKYLKSLIREFYGKEFKKNA